MPSGSTPHELPVHALARQSCRSPRLLVLDQLRQRSAKRCTRASTRSRSLVARCPCAAPRPPARALQGPPSANPTSHAALRHSTRTAQIPIAARSRPRPLARRPPHLTRFPPLQVFGSPALAAVPVALPVVEAGPASENLHKEVRAVRHQPAAGNEITVRIDRW